MICNPKPDTDLRSSYSKDSGFRSVESLARDVRFGARMLRKNLGLTIAAVLTLAVGIGATSAVFDLIRGVLLTPPPYPKPEQVVLIAPARKDGQACKRGCRAAQWVQWRKETKSFAALAGYTWTFDFLIQPDGSESFQGMEVTTDYFKVIGIAPLLGRAFVDSDTTVGPATVAILGYEFWQRKFNGDPKILGKTLRVSRDGGALTVVGVMPPGVRFLPASSDDDFPNADVNARVDYWVPTSAERSNPNDFVWNVAGRLRDGATPAQAQVELTTLAARQAQTDRELEGITARVQPLTAELNRDGERLLLPLMGAVVLVFLIACGNVAGLLLARGLQRQPEYAVRSALGAKRGQLLCQTLIESLLLALAGGTLGIALAVGIIRTLKVTHAAAIPRLDAVATDWTVMAFCLGSSILAAVLAGLAPALRASRLGPALAIRGVGLTASAGRAERRILTGVAVFQTALTLALLVGAGLLIRTVGNLAKVRPGYQTANLLTMSVTLPDWSPKNYEFRVRALERVSAIPGVKNVAFAWGMPLTGDKWAGPGIVEGQPETGKLADLPPAVVRSVTPGYFDSLGIKIVAGRGFRSSDSMDTWKSAPDPRPGEAPLVAVVNQALADRCAPLTNVLGRQLRFHPWPKRTCEIVGIVANTRSEALTKPPGPEVYYCFLQVAAFTAHLVVRTGPDPRVLSDAVQRELRAIEPTVAIEHVRTFDQIRSESVRAQTFGMQILSGFALVASAMALVGIYGVLSLSAGARRREMAIRTAVGAQRREVLALLLREGLMLLVTGVLLGSGVVLALGRALQVFLFEVGPADPPTLVGVAILFTAAGLLACLLPALRATRVDPMTALRCE